MVSILPLIFPRFLAQAFGNRSKCTIYNWYHRHLHAPLIFWLSGKIQVFVYLFTFFYFHSTGLLEWQNPLDEKFFLFLLILGLVFWLELGDPFVSQNLREFYGSRFLDRFLFVHIPFVSMVKFESFAQFPLDHLSHPVIPSLVLCRFAAFAYYVINCFNFSFSLQGSGVAALAKSTLSMPLSKNNLSGAIIHPLMPKRKSQSESSMFCSDYSGVAESSDSEDGKPCHVDKNKSYKHTSTNTATKTTSTHNDVTTSKPQPGTTTSSGHGARHNQKKPVSVHDNWLIMPYLSECKYES